jgi:Aspartyl protease
MDTNRKIINPDFDNWVNNNRELLRKYVGNYVAFNEELGFIVSKKTFEETEEEALKIASNAILYYVNPYSYGGRRFLPIRFNRVKIHAWQPVKLIKLQALDKETYKEMLIDSGDCSLISYRTGLKLGLSLAALEELSKAQGIGGTVEYVIRKLDITINNHTLTVPVAWVQNPECEDEIIGREVIFDYFNIEFRQSEEKIVFTPVHTISEL